MSDSTQFQDEWTEMVQHMNDAIADSVERNVEAQAALLEAWVDGLEDSVPDDDVMADGIEGYSRAYEVWMDAAAEVGERTTDAARGEDVEPEELRDIWLESANQAFKEIMSTSAFASANGQLVESMLEFQQEVDDASQDAVSQLGLPTRDDVDEIGARLVELERRQHDVEEKLDRVLEALED